MNFKHIVKSDPSLITLLPTHKCSASCRNCCFGCNPKIDYIMPYDDMVKYVDEALDAFPSIQLLVLTGGECFLLGSDLDKIIEYGSSKGLLTRVVTNAFWAESYDKAFDRLLKLRQVGLTEINVSTGKYHQEYVNPQNIINACVAAIDVGFPVIQVAHEVSKDSGYEKWQENERIAELINDKKVEILKGPWMNFRVREEVDIPDNILVSESHGRCKSLFCHIIINPYSQMLSCCGLSAEYNPYLKLGDLRNESMSLLYDSQFNDLYLLWLHTHGPKKIYDLIAKKRNFTPKIFPHICAYCIEIIQDNENIKVLKSLIKKELPTILMELQLINKSLT